MACTGDVRSGLSAAWLAFLWTVHGLLGALGQRDAVAARALQCKFDGANSVRLQRFRKAVAASARLGFELSTLSRALKDADFFSAQWAGLMPTVRLMGIVRQLRPGILNNLEISWNEQPAEGAKLFAEQLFDEQLTGETDSGLYCLFAHIMAVLVKARFTPLLYLCRVRSLAKTCNANSVKLWLARASHARTPVRLSAGLYEEMRMLLVPALLLLGNGRELDQAPLLGWPVSGADLAELLEVFYTVYRRPTGRLAGSVQDFERAARVRLRLARRLGCVRHRRYADSLALQAVQQGAPRLNMWARMSAEYRLARGSAAGLDTKLGIRVFHLGTHGAFFNLIKASWLAAEAHANLGLDLRFADVQNTDRLYNPGDTATQKYRTERWASNTELVSKFIRFEPIDHTYVYPESLRPLLLEKMRNFHAGFATILLCTIPFITCALFADSGLPVVHYAPTIPNVQIHPDVYSPVLMLFRRMARESKNHFLVNSVFIQYQIEYLTDMKLALVPMPCLHTNATYTGSASRDVLVRDRNFAGLFFLSLRSMVPDGYPLHLIHYIETDRRFSTFAAHRAVVYMQYTLDGQLAFFEFYTMGVPMFIPTTPTRYVWPRLGATLFYGVSPGDVRGSFRRWAHCENFPGEFSKVMGRHELKQVPWAKSKDLVYINYTISCTGRVGVHVANPELLGGTQASEKAELVQLDHMDGFSNTHALIPLKDPNASGLVSHGGRCLRLSTVFETWGQVLSVKLGPPPGRCPELDRPGGCRSGLGDCPRAMWTNFVYVANPRSPVPEAIPLDGFEKGGSFGNTHAFIGYRAATRRRRGATSPFDLRTHRRFREHSLFMDPFQYPGILYFASAAELLWRLVELRPEETSATMRSFNTVQLARALTGWASVLGAAALHPSQGHAAVVDA